jgi:hypothetical protein
MSISEGNAGGLSVAAKRHRFASPPANIVSPTQPGSTNFKHPLEFEESENLILIDNLSVVGRTVKVTLEREIVCIFGIQTAIWLQILLKIFGEMKILILLGWLCSRFSRIW